MAAQLPLLVLAYAYLLQYSIQKGTQASKLDAIERGISPNIRCLLSITISLLAATYVVAISLDADQDRQNVGPDLDPNCLTF